MGKAWNIVQTKAKLSEVLKRANFEPQVIESRGQPVAVIISMEEFVRLSQFGIKKLPKPTMKDFLQLSKRLSKKIKGDKIELILPDRKDRKIENLGD
jgi:prevent-host-death family protein